MTTPETLSFDGRSVIRSDEYRTAAAELNRYQTAEQIAYYGNLFASAPALYAALEAIAELRPPLMAKEQEKAFEHYASTCDSAFLAKVLIKAISEARAALALARGEKGGE